MDSGQTTSDFWTIFGTQLAAMHQQTNESFGLNHANYIGSLKQVNNQHSDWVSFFIEERLEFQLRMARDNGEIGSDFSRMFEKLFHKLETLFPIEPPALVHGDLWGGNFMVNEKHSIFSRLTGRLKNLRLMTCL